MITHFFFRGNFFFSSLPPFLLSFLLRRSQASSHRWVAIFARGFTKPTIPNKRFRVKDMAWFIIWFSRGWAWVVNELLWRSLEQACAGVCDCHMGPQVSDNVHIIFSAHHWGLQCSSVCAHHPWTTRPPSGAHCEDSDSNVMSPAPPHSFICFRRARVTKPTFARLPFREKAFPHLHDHRTLCEGRGASL